ncbi:ribonuclease R [Mollicutes bacterium LVI A0039]|nr:ribonuclease R [Mollicutes bacterium LVI A0039]
MNIDRLNQVLKDYNNNNFKVLDDDLETRHLYGALLEHDIIAMKQNGHIKKLDGNKVAVGRLQVKGRFGFVVNDDGLDHYVHDIGNCMPDDLVLVIESQSPKGRSQEAKVVDVIERKITQVLAFVNKDKQIEVANNHAMRMYNIRVGKKVDLNPYVDTYVLVNITSVRRFAIYGSIDHIVTDKNDPDLQMKLVLHEFDIETEFSEQVINDAEVLAQTEIVPEEGRVDLTEHLFFTIDGADAKDLDDAVCLIKEDENYRLFVSIADVSYYVTEGSALDKSAFSRSTSVYFVDRVVPMLPKSISNGICSLHPNVLRYTQTCEMLINPEGHVIDSKIYPSLINSKYRMTYEDVNAMLLESDKRLIAKYSEIYGVLREMNKLAKRINENRVRRGSFNLEDKEAKFTVDSDGNIIDINVRTRYDAERLIEEFMIIANETVAVTIHNMELPFIYRVHGQPAPVKLQELEKLFKLFGIDLKGDYSEFHSSSFKKVLDSLDDPLDKRIISDLIVRSLQKAVYSPKNSGHFGLASKGYTHFTSPIRRYPDLIVHRLLRKYLYEHKIDRIDHIEGKLTLISDVTSDKERKAIKAEQKIEDQKKAEYMRQFIGDKFVGKVASIVDFGFFVELENTQRGLVRFKELVDFVKVQNFTIKLKNNKQIKIGDEINVQLVAVDSIRGIVDFKPLDLNVREVKVDENRRKQQKGKTRLYNSKNAGSRNRTRGKRNKIRTSRKSQPQR